MLTQLKKEGHHAYGSLKDIGSDKKFDLITLWHVLEHLPNPKETIRNLKGRLNAKGLLVLAVPNLNSFDASYYQEFWAGYDLPRHLWHFSNKGLQKIIENSGFSLISKHPLFFDSFYISILSQRHKTGKTQILKAIYIGLISNLKAIKKGGSSIRDFKNISGSKGEFQKNFNVYQQAGKKCKNLGCSDHIKKNFLEAKFHMKK